MVIPAPTNPILNSTGLGVTELSNNVVPINRMAIITREVFLPNFWGRPIISDFKSSFISLITLAKWAATPRQAAEINNQSGGVRSVATTMAATNAANANAYGNGERRVNLK